MLTVTEKAVKCAGAAYIGWDVFTLFAAGVSRPGWQVLVFD